MKDASMIGYVELTSLALCVFCPMVAMIVDWFWGIFESSERERERERGVSTAKHNVSKEDDKSRWFGSGLQMKEADKRTAALFKNVTRAECSMDAQFFNGEQVARGNRAFDWPFIFVLESSNE